MDAEGLAKLSVDYVSLGFVITERPESQGLVFVVDNIRPPSPSELSMESGNESRQNRVLFQRQKSEETLARIQAKQEAKRVQDEKRAADLAHYKLEFKRIKKSGWLIQNQNKEFASKIESKQKELDELTVQHEALTKEFEDLLEEVIQSYSEDKKEQEVVTNELIQICNSVLMRETD